MLTDLEHASLRRRLVLIVSGVVAAVLVVGLGIVVWKIATRSDASPLSPVVTISPSPSTALTPSLTPSLTSSEQAATEEVLRIYYAYNNVAAEASSSGQDYSEQLKQYLADPLRTQVLLDLRQQRQKGVMYDGELKLNPKVTAVKLNGTPPTATIEDCLDATNYRLVFRSSKSPVPVPTQSRRYVAVTTATLYPDYGWLLNEGKILQGRIC